MRFFFEQITLKTLDKSSIIISTKKSAYYEAMEGNPMRSTTFWSMIITGVMIIFTITACGPQHSAAVVAVEEFFQAIIEKNQPFFESRVCPEYLMEAMLDFNAFAIVETSMENFSCQASGSNSNGVQVDCTGSIQARFGDEIRRFDLSRRTYQVIEDDGSWLVCGHSDLE